MGAVASGVGGIVGGLINSQRDSGHDVGSNIFAGGNEKIYGLDPGTLQNNAGSAIRKAGENTYANNIEQVQNNPLLSGMFGNQGLLGQSINQTKDLMNRGFSLQPEDHEAYGQASGNIARMFGQSEQSMAQALSDRGLSSSGVAGNAFAGSQGNKNEALSNIQMQIADHRMQMNNQRLGLMNSMVNSLGGQAQNALGQSANINSQNAKDQYGLATGYMGNIQGTNQQAFQDRQSTMQPSQFSNFLGGAVGGAGAGAKMFGSMSGSPASGAQKYNFSGADGVGGGIIPM